MGRHKVVAANYDGVHRLAQVSRDSHGEVSRKVTYYKNEKAPETRHTLVSSQVGRLIAWHQEAKYDGGEKDLDDDADAVGLGHPNKVLNLRCCCHCCEWCCRWGWQKQMSSCGN